MIGLGERIKNARTAKRVSQLELAEAIGRKQVSISRVERGEIEPPYDQLRKIARFLGVTMAYLLGEDDEVKLVESFKGKVFTGSHESTYKRNKANLVIESVQGDNKTRIEIPSGTDAALVLEILKFMREEKARI